MSIMDTYHDLCNNEPVGLDIALLNRIILPECQVPDFDQLSIIWTLPWVSESTSSLTSERPNELGE